MSHVTYLHHATLTHHCQPIVILNCHMQDHEASNFHNHRQEARVGTGNEWCTKDPDTKQTAINVTTVGNNQLVLA